MICIPGCTHFVLEDLVDPWFIERFGADALRFLDQELVNNLELLAVTLGPIKVNDWASGGKFTDSGLRRQQSKIGATYSDHKMGRAFDCKPAKTTPEIMAQHILANRHRYQAITVLEDWTQTKTWLHIARHWHTQPGIRKIAV